MRDHFFQRQFVAHLQVQGKLPVIVGRLDAEQRRSHRQHCDRRVAGGQPPQPDRARFQNFRVRGKFLQRKHIARRQQLRAVAVLGRQQTEECLNALRQRLGLLVAIYYNNQRTACGLPQQHRIYGFGGVG